MLVICNIISSQNGQLIYLSTNKSFTVTISLSHTLYAFVPYGCVVILLSNGQSTYFPTSLSLLHHHLTFTYFKYICSVWICCNFIKYL